MSGSPGAQRGMTGLAAPLVRWLLWSPRRALLSAVLVVVGAILLARLVVGTPPPSAPATPAGTPASSTVAAPPADQPASGMTPDVVATHFAQHWVRRDQPPERWAASLAPWCTDAYGTEVLPTIDPTTVPASQVRGAAHVARRDHRSAEVLVPLDALTIRVSLLDTTGGSAAAATWRVNDVNPADNPAAGG
ncbi:MAG: hypothetical protein ACRD0H_18745 [Actinomycetes bacterium]